MSIRGLDHVAMPTRQPEALIGFYGQLGFRVPTIEEWSRSKLPFFSMSFGDQKINVHAPALWERDDFTLRGPTAQPGCADLCFVWDSSVDALHARLRDAGAAIIAGPVELEGARGTGVSTYVRDPDGNLLEFIVYASP